MNSIERHEARYARRKASREKKKLERNRGHSFVEVSSPENLRKAFIKCKKGVDFKESIKKYGSKFISNTYVQSERLRSGIDIRKGFIEFDIFERGKPRHIQSVHISERLVQKSLCDNALVPVIERSLIFDNGASQRGKGTSFSQNRLRTHLRRWYRRNGCSGYILIGDCHNFFGSVNHSEIKKNLVKWFTDPELIKLTMQFVDAFDSGLGLGSQVCQILAVSYQNRIDHYIKEVMRCKEYARYMDDFYLICETKEQARDRLEKIRTMYRDIGIELNPRKTQIVKLSHGFTWLKDRYYVLPSGRIVVKASRENISRCRKKMTKLAKMLAKKEIPYETVRAFYASRSGYLKNKNAYITKKHEDELYNKLIIGGFTNEDITFEQRQCHNRHCRHTAPGLQEQK